MNLIQTERTRLADAAAKLGRFTLVGGLNTLIYCGITVLAVTHLGIQPRWASLTGYVTTLPIAFIAHRIFTFRSIGDPRSESWRFVATHVAGLTVSIAAMAVVVDWLGMHYGLGMVLVSVLVPIVSVLIMDRWVFPDQKDRRRDQLGSQ